MSTHRVKFCPAVAGLLAGVVLLAGAGRGVAEPTAEVLKTQTVITSDTLMFDYGRRLAVFDGNVVVKDTDLTLTADKLKASFTEDNDIEFMEAVGRVVLVQGDRKGECAKATYSAASGQIVLTAKPGKKVVLRRSRDFLQGDEVIINVNSEKVICRPGMLTIYPESGKSVNLPR
jgi:lipopolysaccharide transport protein LptA